MKRLMSLLLTGIIIMTVVFSALPAGAIGQTMSVKYGTPVIDGSIDKIWQSFYKTDLSRGRDKTGSGIGLSIVKEIIRAHNENIDVISTEGVGTEFVFSIKHAKSKTL